MSAPQILGPRTDPPRARTEHHGHWVICGLIICPRVPTQAARPVSGCCPVCRISVNVSADLAPGASS